MQCMNKCGKEVTGRGKYCSLGCKQAAYRDRQTVTSVTDSVTVRPESVTVEPSVTEFNKIAADFNTNLIPNFGLPNCDCKHCLQNRANGSKHTINHGPYKTASQLGDKELNRVSLPGDADYDGVAQHIACS